MHLLGITKLSCFHLALSVALIVVFFGSRDQIQHMSSNQKATQLLKVTVLVILDFSYTPSVLSTDHVSTISCGDTSHRADDSKWHC